LEGGLLPLFSSHPRSSGYPYHQGQLLDCDGHHHYWFNLHKYGATNIDDDNTCSDDGCSWKDTIIHWASTKHWFHSPCYWNVWVSSFLFLFIFDCLCTYHYGSSTTISFNPLDACFLLLIAHVHGLATCTSHTDSLMNRYIWLKFFISSSHNS
jgi:hypothetical protein